MNKRLEIDEDQSCVVTDAKKRPCIRKKLPICENSCSALKIEALTPPVQHGEGPHWDPKNNVLYFVDTFQATAYRLKTDADKNEIVYHKLEGRDSIGIILPVKNTTDEFVIAADRYIFSLKWKADEKCVENFNELKMIDEDKPKNQANDGKADANGRIWLGTLTREKDLSVAPNGGALYRIDLGKHVSTHIENTSISNGIAWSSDNRKFYYIDSSTRNIVEYDFDLKSGNLGKSRTLFDLNDHPNIKGILDGMTIDNRNNLWIALFGGHGVINVDGKTGKLLKFVKLPVTYCTSACFGGSSMDILFVTTSKLRLSKEEEKKEEKAGSVFAIRNLGVAGPAPYECVI